MFSGCKKQKTPTTYYIPQISKDYMLWKIGDYWIYQNETTKSTDSCYIKNGPNIGYPQPGGYPDDPIIETYSTDFFGNTIVHSLINDENAMIDFKQGGSGITCFVPYTLQHVLTYYDNSVFKLLNTFQSLVVNNFLFNNVVNTEYLHPKFFSHETVYDAAIYTFYIAKNIGIIKFRKQYKQGNYLADTTWSIIRYKSSK